MLQLLDSSLFLTCQPVLEGWQFYYSHRFCYGIPVCLAWPVVLPFASSDFLLGLWILRQVLFHNHTGFPYLLDKLTSDSGSFISILSVTDSSQLFPLVIQIFTVSTFWSILSEQKLSEPRAGQTEYHSSWFSCFLTINRRLSNPELWINIFKWKDILLLMDVP